MKEMGTLSNWLHSEKMLKRFCLKVSTHKLPTYLITKYLCEYSATFRAGNDFH